MKEYRSVLHADVGMFEAHPLGMPLHAEDGQALVVHGFYDEVVAVLGHKQPVADISDALVVGAVGDGGASVKLFGESASGGFCGVDFIAVFFQGGRFVMYAGRRRTLFFRRGVCVDKL